MNLLDNVKNKLGLGGDGYDDDYDEYDYDDEYGDDYEDDYDEGAEADDGRGSASWPSSLNSSSRRESRMNEGTPLVSSYDVRSTRKPAAQPRNNSSPDYDSVMQNYKIAPRNAGYSSSEPGTPLGSGARSPEQLEAAREELGQLQRNYAAAGRRIVCVVPDSYNDAVKITAALRGGSSAAVSFKKMNPALAKRLLDFCFGVVSMTGGSVEKVANNVFFLSRNGQPITDQEKQQIKDAGLL